MAVNQDTEDSIGDYLDMDVINCMGENNQNLQATVTSLNGINMTNFFSDNDDVLSVSQISSSIGDDEASFSL